MIDVGFVLVDELSHGSHATMQEVIVEAGRTVRNYWRDLWHYRELFRVLALPDVSARYQHTVNGSAWALNRPFLTMVVFTIIFGVVTKFPSDGVPYPLL